MGRGVDLLVCLALAGALHAAALRLMPGTAGGGGAGGMEGDAPLTLAGADAQLAALVARWDTPPETAPAPERGTAPPTVPGTPVLAQVTGQSDGGAPAQPPVAADLPAGDLPALAAPVAPAAPVAWQPPPAEPDARRSALPDPVPAPAPPPEPPPDPQPRTAAKTDTGGDPPPVRALRPQPRPAAAPALIAGGDGGSATRGTTAGPGAANARASGQAALRRWGAEIAAEIQRRLHGSSRQGRVVLRLALSPSGRVEAVSVLHGSGDAWLDRAAREAARPGSRLAPAPRELAAPLYRFDLPILFR